VPYAKLPRGRGRECASGSARPAEDLPLFTRFDECTIDVRLVREALVYHNGAKRAVTSRALAEQLHMDERRLRQVIAHLVAEGALIGASVGSREDTPAGYYLIETWEELEAARAILRSRAKRIFERDTALRKAGERRFGRPLQPLLPEMA